MFARLEKLYKLTSCTFIMIVMISGIIKTASAQQVGSIRGTVYDKDFDVPLAAVQVSIAETGEKVTTTDEGNYVFEQVPPGTYILVFSKEGYTRQVKSKVVVLGGQLTEEEASLSGEFTEMEEFVVQDLRIVGTEAGLLQLRVESPGLLDSISSELLSRAGAGDAASALKLVAGATVSDEKYAVVRGLPDRYVNSQINNIRLPTADVDKRAVELDQFPSDVIESIQVTKTFTPDQQGDTSGGAVNVVLKGIPDEERILKVKVESGYNTNATGKDRFLSYEDGGVNFWADADGERDPQLEKVTTNWDGAVGPSKKSASFDYKFSLAGGGKKTIDSGLFDSGITLGGFANFYYKRDSSLSEGTDDYWWVESPGDPLTPQTFQGPQQGGDYKTRLSDVTIGKESVKWGGVGILGVEIEDHSVDVTYLYTRTAQDKATIAEDTRGKEYFFPGYDPNNVPSGHNEDSAPYNRSETLEYTERTTETIQVKGEHKLPTPEFKIFDILEVLRPEFDWKLSASSAGMYQPDKRIFGSLWKPEREIIPGLSISAHYAPYKPGANFTLGNLQRIWREIHESSKQYAIDLKFPFSQWTDDEGYVKLGIFEDTVKRDFSQESFSNFNDNATRSGIWEIPWSQTFPGESSHLMVPSEEDVNYRGDQKIRAYYYMLDLPVNSFLNLLGGIRYENTRLKIVNDPEENAEWYAPDPNGTTNTKLNPGEADVNFKQADILPSVGFTVDLFEKFTLRGSYAETLARQTFKELTPIVQFEYLGGPVFIGNPQLKMSALKNIDMRLDYKPYAGGLISFSWFKKYIENPIEYVQKVADFNYTTAENYPKGILKGYEIEMRQDLGHFWEKLEGLSFGANATLIDAKVYYPAAELKIFSSAALQSFETTRDMLNTPEYLYNYYLTYDLGRLGLKFNFFYTLTGDTLLVGRGQKDGNLVPGIYAKTYESVNITASKKIGKHMNLEFKAKNLTNPKIDTVYRAKGLEEVTHTSFRKGIDFSLGLSYEW